MCVTNHYNMYFGYIFLLIEYIHFKLILFIDFIYLYIFLNNIV